MCRLVRLIRPLAYAPLRESLSDWHDLGEREPVHATLFVRARLSLAVAAQQSADAARGVIGDVSTPMPPGQRIRKARRVRLTSLTVVDRAVLAELSEGASWGVVADALGVTVTEAERRYGPTWNVWVNGDNSDAPAAGEYSVGLGGDPDMAGTAEALDQWWRRHAEPYETVKQTPVSDVLAEGGA